MLNLCIIPSTKGGIPKPIPAHLFQTAEIREASSYNRPLRHHRISTSEGVASQIFELLFYSVYIYIIENTSLKNNIVCILVHIVPIYIII